jgi:mycoredoxin
MTADNLYSLSPNTIVAYSKPWCPDCRRALRLMSDSKIPFIIIDISNDPKAKEFVRQINHGNESVPTIIFPDGGILVEPENPALLEKLKRTTTDLAG